MADRQRRVSHKKAVVPPKLPALALTLVVLGLCTIVLSVVWPRLVPVDTMWTEEQAREKSAASANLHHATHEAAHAEDDPSLDEASKQRARELKREAQERFDASREALDRVQRWRKTVASILRWSGSILTAIGVVWYYAISAGSR